MLPALINHLWQSTLFAVGAGFLTLMLRRNSARIRYGLWFSASLKFLLPFALLAALGSHIPRYQSDLGTNTDRAQMIGMAIERIAAPIPATARGTDAAPRGAAWTHSWLKLLAMGWACGVLAIAGHWLSGWRRIRRIRIASRPTAMDFPIPVRRSTAMQEPAVAGIVRPVLLVPEGIEDWLSAEQLRAVLAHELCHVRRRDNLMAALHMLVEALFWFHPLVWWLEARLIAERERACDEDVLAEGNSAQSYAEGIVRVCQNCLDSPLRYAAGVAGGNLAKRIDLIMSSPRRVRLSVVQAIVLGGMASAALAEPIVSGHLEASARAPASDEFSAAADNAGKGAAEVDRGWQDAVRLPQSVWVRLKQSDWPAEREMFRRNRQLTRAGGADAWGGAVQAQLMQFFATRPAAGRAQITVACREVQCQMQLVLPLATRADGEAPSELMVDDLRRQPWYQNELLLSVGQIGVNDGKTYHLQYFDRKSAVSSAAAPTTSPEPASACVRPAVSSDRPDVYQLMCDQMKAYGPASLELASLVHAHDKVAGAPDDPEWARPTERRIREAIAADAAAQNLDIRSVACRKTGCVLEFFDTNPSTDLKNLPAWIQVVEHFRKSELGTVIDMDANFGSKYGDRVMYVTTFTRKPSPGGGSR